MSRTKKKKSNSPIIFCHYGDTNYLKYTLKQARYTNPEKRIILLGDEQNRYLKKKAKIEHYIFENFNFGSVNIQFDRVYKHIAGEKHGREFWTKFVFKRWFYIHEFLQKEKIKSFWHFDSDNMILTNLSEHESKFNDFDCTEQCNGSCMNGFVSSFKVVDGYIKKINDLFEDEIFLENFRKRLANNPTHAFTEMFAYKTYKDQENIKSIRLNTIIDNEAFDDNICEQQCYAIYKHKINGHNLKKIYTDNCGNLYCYHLESNSYIKMNSLNLSWVPIDLFRLISEISQGKYKKRIKHKFTQKEFILLDLSFLKGPNTNSTIIKWLPISIHKFIKSLSQRY